MNMKLCTVTGAIAHPPPIGLTGAHHDEAAIPSPTLYVAKGRKLERHLVPPNANKCIEGQV